MSTSYAPVAERDEPNSALQGSGGVSAPIHISQTIEPLTINISGPQHPIC